MCCGKLPDKNGEFVDYLLKDGKNNVSKVVKEGTAGAKYAKLLYETLKEIEKDDKVYTLVKVTLITGRHHQIRVQMAAAGRPLLGDSRYGSEASREESARWGVRNVALCADRITFRHPVTRKQMEFSILPEQEIYQKF